MLRSGNKRRMSNEEGRRYSVEFRRRMVGMVRGGRSPESLAEEFGPAAQTIRDWVRDADQEDGDRSDGLTAAERREIRRLRRENRRLREEVEILKKAETWFARKTPKDEESES